MIVPEHDRVADTTAQMKVLIVDDDAVNIALLVGALRGNYELYTSQNGFDAIAIAKEERPDLILLDVMMPDLTGMDLCRVLRADETLSSTPVIFVTAVDSAEGEQEGLELGAVDYITKPVNLKLAKLRIRNQLELKRQRDRIAAQNAVLTRQKADLEATLVRVGRLEGLLSICMYCKKIRGGNDVWQRLEQYISEHSDARFSHGLCPDCERVEHDKIQAELVAMRRPPL